MENEYIRKQDAVDMFNRAVQDVGILDADDIEIVFGMLSSADVVPVVRCKGCMHNNDCDIQYSAQAGDNFFCGFGETEKDVRGDVYE